ncbi:hypothetical protein EET67_24820 [Pseudaminobacter arsenicus]|uniref:Terminase large subunit-like endonuclease domain-containing protein n=1 Tax=Borborobacter arsenicus TaxID=1851146 RepID=A0A432UZ19_9HYPH|nr:terminase TerL endonuclease subunit [Pseudaminobacter arsenicus]RUM95159.1 hypothetical protein EET67_24820 [Pseudaminobacter arsenicus]
MRGQSLAAMPLRQAEAEVTRVQRDYRPMVKTVESYSPYRTFAGEIVQHLADEGLNLVQFGQGFLSMAAPTAELERLSVSRNLWHGGHPVLRWNASNVAVRHDPAGNIKPDKERSTVSA